MEKLDKLGLSLLGFPESSDETPSTAISTLPHPPTPLPPTELGSWVQVGYGLPASCVLPDVPSHSGDAWQRHNVNDDDEAVLKAPCLRDLDSFTEGTGKGSFDSLLDEYPQEQGDLFYHPNSLELLPFRHPTPRLSIETWREQVSSDDLDPYDDDALHRFARSGDVVPTAEVNLGSDDVVVSVEYRPPSPVSPDRSTSGSPRPMKRSRSRSPEPSRRIRARPRSQSLSSVQSLTVHIFHGLTSAPPWRVNNFRLPPFD